MRITDSIAWAEARIADNKIYDMYEKFYGKRRPIEIWEEYDAICYQPEWKKLIETMPSELEDIQNNAKSVLEPMQWQMIMNSKDDADFDKQFDAIAAQAEELNVREIYDWSADQITKAKEAFKKYE